MNNFNLHNEPKIKSGFIIPDNYFENLSNNLQSKLVEAPIKVISLTDRIAKNKTWIASTAAVLLISISALFYSNNQSNNNQKYAAELENYITNHPAYSDDDIVNLLNTNEIKEIQFDSKLNTETIENQLLENTDFEQIITN